MTLEEATNIVVRLAEKHALEQWRNNDESQDQERLRNLEAIGRMDDLLTLLRVG